MNKRNEVRRGDPIAAAIIGALGIYGGMDILFSARSALHEIEGLLFIGFALVFFIASTLLHNQRKLWKTIQDIKEPEEPKDDQNDQ